MPDSTPRTAKTREQTETELMETLRQRRHEWVAAPHDQRDYARQRFMDALQNFNALVLYGKPPLTE